MHLKVGVAGVIITGLGQEEQIAGGFITTTQVEIGITTEQQTLAGSPVQGISLGGTNQVGMTDYVGGVANKDTYEEIAGNKHRQIWWTILKKGMGHSVNKGF